MFGRPLRIGSTGRELGLVVEAWWDVWIAVGATGGDVSDGGTDGNVETCGSGCVAVGLE